MLREPNPVSATTLHESSKLNTLTSACIQEDTNAKDQMANWSIVLSKVVNMMVSQEQVVQEVSSIV